VDIVIVIERHRSESGHYEYGLLGLQGRLFFPAWMHAGTGG
jgi:hypothetical protein